MSGAAYSSRLWALSANNCTTAPLGAAATFTGTADVVEAYASISVTVFADQASAANGFKLQGSQNGTDWDASETLTVSANTSQTHTRPVGPKYFRVVYVNGSVEQTTFRMQTIFHGNKGPQLTTSTQQVLERHDDVILTRLVSDLNLDRSSGKIAYESEVHAFGSNPALAAGSEEDIWSSGSAYPWLTAADNLRVKAGGNVNDTAAGTGARSVKLTGLDSTFAVVTETLATAGASASASTSSTFIRLHKAEVATTGAYTVNNTGAIAIETDAGTTIGNILAGKGHTELSVYTVGAGKTGYVTRVDVEVAGGKAADVFMWKRSGADTVAAPFTPKVLVMVWNELIGPDNTKLDALIELPEKTDVWFSATALSGGGGSACAVNYDVLLVDD